MAAGFNSASNRSASEALHKLEEQLTCSICLEQYTNPKILPCFHSFCLHCLRGVLPKLAKQGNHSLPRSLPCPTCRSPCQLPQQGVDGLPPSFTINNLTEVYNLLKKVSDKGHTSCDKCQKQNANQYCKQCGKFLCQQCLQLHNEWITNHETLGLDEVANTAYQLPQVKPEVTSNCPTHSDEPLKIFCEKCEELICQLCTVKKHKDHDYDVVTDAYTKHKLIIEQSSLQPLNLQINVIAKAINNLIGRRTEITEQGENTKAETHEVIVQIKELLDETERRLNKEVHEVVEYKLAITDQQTKEAKAVLGKLTECRDHIQQSLAVDTPHQVLSTKAQMVSHTESLLEAIKDEKRFQPLEQANLRLVRNNKQNIEDLPISYVGTIEYSNATPTSTTSFDHTPIIGQECTVNMSLSLEDGLPAPVPSYLISCYLTPPSNDSSLVQCTVKGTSQTGQYSVVFTPRTRGFHQLYVKLNDRIIPGNPVSIPVTVPVNTRGDVVRTIAELRGLYGVTVSDDGWMYSSNSVITIITRDGEKVKSFGSRGNGRGQVSSPTGIAITPKYTLLVADWGNDRLQEFTMDGECISCVGGEGNGPLKFTHPRGIAINKTTGQVYIADTNNHRVQVLNADLTFSHIIGCRGSGQGEFQYPVDIAIDSQGFVYVTDTSNNRIQKFTTEGQFDSLFSTKGSEPYRLNDPHCLALDNDLLYISEEGMPHRCISVFTTSGEFVHCFGAGKIQGSPWGMALDKYTGFLYVCVGDNIMIF